MTKVTTWEGVADYQAPPPENGGGGHEFTRLYPHPQIPAGATLLRTRAHFELTFDTEERIPAQVPPEFTIYTYQFRTNNGNEVPPSIGQLDSDFTTFDNPTMVLDYIFDQGVPERLIRYRGQVNADSHAERKTVDAHAPLAIGFGVSNVTNNDVDLSHMALWILVRQLWTWVD